jgi:hypothetical protein
VLTGSDAVTKFPSPQADGPDVEIVKGRTRRFGFDFSALSVAERAYWKECVGRLLEEKGRFGGGVESKVGKASSYGTIGEGRGFAGPSFETKTDSKNGRQASRTPFNMNSEVFARNLQRYFSLQDKGRRSSKEDSSLFPANQSIRVCVWLFDAST